MKELIKLGIDSFYTGVGSRSAPDDILEMMTSFARVMENHFGIKLRTGGAKGSDEAFAKGVAADEMKEIYLPWEGFNGYDGMNGGGIKCWKYSDRHVEIAKSAIGHWKYMNQTHKKFHTRNVAQVLGKNCDSPSLFVMCWTSNGAPIGGTATAIMVAAKNGIPVYNMYYEYVRKGVATLIEDKVFDKEVFGELYEK